MGFIVEVVEINGFLIKSLLFFFSNGFYLLFRFLGFGSLDLVLMFSPKFQGPIPANMKKLYAMLVHLSLTKPDLGWSNSEFAAIHTDENLDNCVSKLNFKAFHDLSDILFKELDRRFEEFFSALRGVSGAGGSGRHVLLADIWAKREELMLLLRCCMVLLILMAFNQSLLIEKGRLILSVLSRLISIELTGGENEKSSITFKRSISLECAYLNVDCTANVTEEFFASISSLEPSDSCYTLLCGVLEVMLNCSKFVFPHLYC